MTMTRTTLTAILALALQINCPAGAEPDKDYTLIKDGKPTSVIVVPHMPPSRTAMWCAKELQDHFKKITGADVPVRYDDESVDAGTVKLSIGDTALSRAAGLDMGKLGEQEYVLQFEPGLICLMGRDQYPNPWPLETDNTYQSGEGLFGRGMSKGSVRWPTPAFPESKGSIEMWVRGDSRAGVLWKIGTDDDQNYHAFYMAPDRDYAFNYSTVADGKKERLLGPRLTPGWHLVTVTWDAEAAKKQILVDGKVAVEGPFEKAKCGGAKAFTLNGPGDGVIDEFRVSKKVVRPYPDGVDKKPFEKDEYTKLLLHFDEEGGVTYDGEKPAVEWPKADKRPDAFSPIGTCYATYDFLERYCDIRWYFPTELGTVVQETKTLTIKAPQNLKRKPALRGRASTPFNGHAEEQWGGRMNNILWNHANNDDAELFQLRMRMGGWAINVNHSFYDWYDRYWEKSANNPGAFVERREDWFAQNITGGDPWRAGVPPQLCYTHTGVIAQAIADAKQKYASGARVVGVVPMDNTSYCQCPNCKARLDSVTTNKSKAFSNGNASELVWWFADQVAKGVAKDCPGLIIGNLSYMDYSAPPKTLVLSPNISAGPCFAPNVYDTLDASIPDNEMNLYKQWVEMKKKNGMTLACWIYQCFPNESGARANFKNWPGFHSERLGIYMKMLARDKIDALFLCGVSSFIDGYLTVRMMDNPTLEPKAVLDEFFPRFYGKAAVPMRKFYDTVESSGMELIGGGASSSFDRYRVAALMRDCGQWMQEAEKLAGTDAEKQRIALFKSAVWEHMQQGYRDYLARWNGKPPYPLSYRNDEKPTERAAGRFGNALKLGQLIGMYEPGFSDEAGTVEFWFLARETGGCLFNIHTDPYDPQHEHPRFSPDTGHELGRGDGVADPKTGEKGYKYYYRTWAKGVTNQILTPPLTGGWHHVAARWSAREGKMQLILDGKQVGAAKYVKTRCATAHRLAIGGVTGTYGSWGDSSSSWGFMDEIRLSKCLRPPAIQKEPYKTDKDTLLLLHFDEENGQYPVESSGRDWSTLPAGEGR